MSKRANIWMPLYVGDYLKDTGRLSTEAHGAYMLLLMDYWVNGPPPDNDDVLSAITRLPVARWKKMRESIASFFVSTDGKWHQKRVDVERAKADKTSSERSVSGKNGAANRWQNDSKRHGKQEASDKQSASQNDAPSQSPSEKEDISVPSSEGVAPASRSPPPKGTRWPSNRVVPVDWILEAEIERSKHGLGPSNLTLAATKFQNYWAAKAGKTATKTDWYRTWINWSLDDDGPKNGGRKPNGHSEFLAGAAAFALRDEVRDTDRYAEGVGDNSGPSRRAFPEP